MKAKSAFRVPVIIYSELSKRDETRLFIDINSKQKGVPTELLLDIKKLAECENNQEEFLREIFDIFLKETSSALYGKLSPATKAKGKITRTTFNASLKPLVKFFGGKTEVEIYEILNNYFTAFSEAVLIRNNISEYLYSTNTFRAICGFFPIIASKVKDRFGAIYSVDNFHHFLTKIGDGIKPSKITNAGSAYKPLVKVFEDCLKDEFTL
jgi:DGQHR domain-containing protein